jgi:hypothetical protein
MGQMIDIDFLRDCRHMVGGLSTEDQDIHIVDAKRATDDQSVEGQVDV